MISPTSVHDIKTLILSFHPLIVIESVEEERVEALLRSAAGQLGLPLFSWSLTRGLKRSDATGAIVTTDTPLKALKHIAKLQLEAVYLMKDFAVHLQDPATARQLREVCQKLRRDRSSLVITGSSIDLPSSLDHKAVTYDLRLPNDEELRAAVTPVVDSLSRSRGVRVELTRDDYGELLRALRGLTLHQARQVVARAIVDDDVLDASDIPAILDSKAGLLREGGLLEYYPQDANHFELGGFGNLKRWLERAEVGFTQAARDMNLPAPRGMVLVGVQGCGKSLAAKVVAKRWGMPLLKLDAGSLYDKYVGETEKNFQRAVAVAESMAPVVLWIDEIEKGFATGGPGEADGGLALRVLGMFLTWMQEKSDEVFVVATANNLDLLPPEMLRKGRFDEVFFVDLPTATERLEIVDIHLLLRKQEPSAFDRDAIVAAADGFSGSEIEQVVVAGLYRSLHEGRPLDTEILLTEIAETMPLSVSRAEDIGRLRATAKDRFVPVR